MKKSFLFAFGLLLSLAFVVQEAAAGCSDHDGDGYYRDYSGSCADADLPFGAKGKEDVACDGYPFEKYFYDYALNVCEYNNNAPSFITRFGSLPGGDCKTG